MKYRVLRSFSWLKAGEIVESIENEPVTILRNPEGGEGFPDKLYIHLDQFPNDFAPISEKEEQIEAAKKLLEEDGWNCWKKGSAHKTPNQKATCLVLHTDGICHDI